MRIIDARTVSQLAPAPLLSGAAFPEASERDLLGTFEALTEHSALFVSAGFSPSEVFASRYYWFMRLLFLRKHRHGYDAGLEQQAFQLLEHPAPPCDPDWQALEHLSEQARADAAQ
jgi:hypothetical protein